MVCTASSLSRMCRLCSLGSGVGIGPVIEFSIKLDIPIERNRCANLFDVGRREESCPAVCFPSPPIYVGLFEEGDDVPRGECEVVGIFVVLVVTPDGFVLLFLLLFLRLVGRGGYGRGRHGWGMLDGLSGLGRYGST